MLRLRQGIIAFVGVGSAAAACATVWVVGGLWISRTGDNEADVTGPAVLAAVVALTLSGRRFASRHDFLRSVTVIPVIGLLAAGIGWLLISYPPLGAACYVVGMSVPIWLRRFGPEASRVGTLMTLPLTAVLIVPIAPPRGGSSPHPLVSIVVLLCANVIAVLWAVLGRELLAALRLLPLQSADTTPTSPNPQQQSVPPSRTRSVRKLPASTRMALQMAVAISVSFIVGWAIFPGHGMWVVLTAFIVNAGNRGRSDVLHKSVLRVAGAVGGTLLLVVTLRFLPHVGGDTINAFVATAAIFTLLFIGTWLRNYNYAFWAMTVTVVLTILQELDGHVTSITASGFRLERVLAIIVGGVIGVGAAWCVLPVRSIDVIRRRLADFLTALSGVIGATVSEREHTFVLFTESLHRVDEVTPAQRARRIVTFTGALGRDSPLPIDTLEAAQSVGVALQDALQRVPGDATSWLPPEMEQPIGLAIRRARSSLATPTEPERMRATFVALAAIIGKVR